MTHERACTDSQNVPRNTLIEVSRMYYERDLNQAMIARAIGVSRSQVSRYLKAARDEGIVTIQIKDNSEQDPQLGQALRERFPHLQHVEIVASNLSSPTATATAVAAAGADLLVTLVKPGDTVCVGAGRTLARLVASLGSAPVKDVTVVQAMGNAGHEGHDIDYNAIAQAIAAAFGTRAYQVNAPAILAEAYDARDLERSHKSIHAAMEQARTANVYVVGLGTLDSDLLFVSTGMLTEADIREVGRSDPAGDICGRFFDDRGRKVPTPFDARIVGVKLPDLKRARASLAVASGPEKARPMLGALNGNFITHVVTDEATATAVLNLSNQRHKAK